MSLNTRSLNRNLLLRQTTGKDKSTAFLRVLTGRWVFSWTVLEEELVKTPSIPLTPGRPSHPLSQISSLLPQ